MTCVWDAIIRELDKDKEKNNLIGIYSNPKEFVSCLKKKNKIKNDVLWQNQQITKKQQLENYEWIQNYNIDGICNGHFTSCADPFLLLISSLLNININLDFCGSKIQIKSSENPRYSINLSNNSYHMH